MLAWCAVKKKKKKVWFRLGVFVGLPQGSVLESGLRGRRAGTDRFQRVRRLQGTRTKAPVSLSLVQEVNVRSGARSH